MKKASISVADPGFPRRGGRGPRRRECGLPRQLRFENFVCQNERIGTLRGCAPGAPPRSANGFCSFVYSRMKSRKENMLYTEKQLNFPYTGDIDRNPCVREHHGNEGVVRYFCKNKFSALSPWINQWLR